MSETPRSIEDVAVRVADGASVDWDETLSSASTDEERTLLQQLQLMQAVARVHGGLETGEAAPEFGEWGHLVLRERLAEGSYGELYRAWDRHLDRDVALKLLKPTAASGESGLSSAIVEEGRLLAKLRHANVVTVFGADTHAGRVGIWMELINGRSLEQWLKQQGTMGAAEAALIGIDLCRALAAVHATGIVHRDVKAQNVMREQGGRILLMDFGAGVERQADPSPLDGKLTGTPFYMAPELLRGAAASSQSDLYSLGVLLYRLVSGRFPAEATSWSALAQRYDRDEVALLRDVRHDLPEAFLAAIERATHRDPGQRFATAGQFEQALSRVPGATNGASPSSRAPGQSGVRRLLLIGAVTLAAILAVLLGVRARREQGVAAIASTGSGASNGVPPAAALPVTQPASYEVSAVVYRVAAGSTARERVDAGARLALGDRLTLEFEASAPLYVYVVNEDEAGHAYALFPLPGLEPQNPLEPGAAHVLPGSRAAQPMSWTVDTPGGREHLLVLASRERLVEYEAEMSKLAQAGQRAVALPEAARLHLRGIGGLASSPAAAATPTAGRLFELARRLAPGPESVSGVWLRHIELENPRP